MTGMEDLSLHVLDVVQNAVRAEARTIHIGLREDRRGERLTLTIGDDGRGMDRETARRATDPFFTTKGGKRVGLGLPFLAQAAEETGGRLTVRSSEGRGTAVRAVFRPAHPDMKPLGDLVETLAALVTAHPEIRFVCDVKTRDMEFVFDSNGEGRNRGDPC